MASISQYKWYSYLGRDKKSLDTMVLVDRASRGIPGSVKLLISEQNGYVTYQAFYFSAS